MFKMKYITLILLFCLQGIYSQKKNNNPPGTAKINENLYMDWTEVNNKDYREFESWTGRVFGRGSREYKEILIDSTITPNSYHKNPVYNDYPVTGVSYEQALKYCAWRSHRVYESKLIQSGIIKRNPDQNRDNYFTIEKVFNGIYKINKPKKLQEILIPNYRLPSVKEWEFAASGGLDIDKYPFGVDTVVVDRLVNNKDSGGVVRVVTNEKIKRNRFGLYNMIGNVAEMVNEKGIAKGCTWVDKITDCGIKNYIQYTKPES